MTAELVRRVVGLGWPDARLEQPAPDPVAAGLGWPVDLDADRDPGADWAPDLAAARSEVADGA